MARSGLLVVPVVVLVLGVCTVGQRLQSIGCEIDEDCSLNGVCSSAKGVCVCDSGWTGNDCGVLKLLPARSGSGFNRTSEDPPVSTWGANMFPVNDDDDDDDDADDDDTGDNSTWYMYASQFENHCDISKWSPNSAIVAAESTTGPLGPFTYKDIAVEPFAHNPKVVQAPDGTWLMYTIGEKQDPNKLTNCSSSELSKHLKTPGRTPKNLESNITLYTSSSLLGPFKRWGIVLGSNDVGTWDEDTSNPSPLIMKNGTILLMYRGCVVAPSTSGCHSEYIGIASAPSWRGPYERLRTEPILPNVSAEDPSLWMDQRGNFHFLMHYIDAQTQVARHAFSRSYTGRWQIHSSSIPYTTQVEFQDGSAVTFHKRERPQLVFSGGIPKYFISGVVIGDDSPGYHGLSYTLIQEVDSS